MKFRLSILIGFLVLALAACSNPTSAPTSTSDSSVTGKAVFSVSDAAANMGNVSDVQVIIDSLRVKAADGTWTTVDIPDQTYALLKLRDEGAAQLLANVDLKPGTYDEIQLHVSNATVKDDKGIHETTLPGNTLTLDGTVNVQAGTTATANFDFLVDKSLHLASDGVYVFAPVIHFEARQDASVQVDTNDHVQVTGGNVSTDQQIGMDILGNTAVGLSIAPDAVLSVSAQGKIRQTGGQALVSGTIKSVDPVAGTVTLSGGANGDVTLQLNGSSGLKVDGSASTTTDLLNQIGSKVNLSFDAGAGSTPSDDQTSGGTGGSTSNETTVSGTLEGINTLSGTITILTDSGDHVVLQIQSGTTVQLGGVLTGLLGLTSNVGTHVTATYDANSKVASSVKADNNATVQSKVAVQGTIESVDQASGVITIMGNDGVEYALGVTGDTALTLDGQASTLAAIAAHSGADVTVTFDQTTNVAQSIDTKATVDTNATVSGTVKAMDAISGKLTVVQDDGTELVVGIANDTKITVDGTTAAVADLAAQIDSNVTVTYDTQTKVASTVDVESSGSMSTSATASGSLDAVSSTGDSITIVTDAGTKLVLKLNSDSKILVSGAVSTAANLTSMVGSQVTVTFDSKTKVANKIEVTGNASTTASVSGSIKAVNIPGSSMTVLTNENVGKVLTVTSNTKITVNGAQATMADLAANVSALVKVTFDLDTNTATDITVG